MIFGFFKENSLQHLKIGKKWIAVKMHQFKWFKRAVFKYPFPFEVSSITNLWFKKDPTHRQECHSFKKISENEQEAWFQLIHVEMLSRVLNYLPIHEYFTQWCEVISEECILISMYNSASVQQNFEGLWAAHQKLDFC